MVYTTSDSAPVSHLDVIKITGPLHGCVRMQLNQMHRCRSRWVCWSLAPRTSVKTLTLGHWSEILHALLHQISALDPARSLKLAEAVSGC